MRTFIILGFLAAAASAGSLGYNYGPGISGTYQATNGAGIIGVGNAGSLTGNVGFGSNYQSQTGGLESAGSGFVSNTGGSQLVSSGGSTVLGLDALNSAPQRVELHKQFYHFTAPEEQQHEGAVRQQLSNVLKKNLQVIFIKAPENNAATNAALQIAKQAIEQRTAIYVLSKENDASQVIGQLQQIQENVPTTPEVRFVKYRTPADLAYAREIIQSQYNTLGGSSQNINGGVAPVLNYASKGAASGSGILYGGGSGGGSYASSTGSGISGNYVSGTGSGSLFGSGIGGGNYVSGTGSGTLFGSGTGGGSYASGTGSGTLFGSGTGGGNYVSKSKTGTLIDSSSNFGSGVASSNYLPPTALKK